MHPVVCDHPGAAGAFYEFLDADKRKAIEIVVEQRAAYRDPEDADGNLPELEQARNDAPGEDIKNEPSSN